ncbi:hypothetical protein CBL_12062 [Carabus blaptoides fortunei]
MCVKKRHRITNDLETAWETHRTDGSSITPGNNSPRSIPTPSSTLLTVCLHNGHSRSASKMPKICYGNVVSARWKENLFVPKMVSDGVSGVGRGLTVNYK